MDFASQDVVVTVIIVYFTFDCVSHVYYLCYVYFHCYFCMYAFSSLFSYCSCFTLFCFYRGFPAPLSYGYGSTYGYGAGYGGTGVDAYAAPLQHTSAYMLTYIRQSELDRILCPVCQL